MTSLKSARFVLSVFPFVITFSYPRNEQTLLTKTVVFPLVVDCGKRRDWRDRVIETTSLIKHHVIS